MTNSSFADKCRAVAWLIALLVFIGVALAGLLLDWTWPKIVIPAVIALLMSLIAPGRVSK